MTEVKVRQEGEATIPIAEFRELLDYCAETILDIDLEAEPRHIVLIVRPNPTKTGSVVTTSVKMDPELAGDLLDFLLQSFPEEIVTDALSHRLLRREALSHKIH